MGLHWGMGGSGHTPPPGLIDFSIINLGTLTETHAYAPHRHQGMKKVGLPEATLDPSPKTRRGNTNKKDNHRPTRLPLTQNNTHELSRRGDSVTSLHRPDQLRSRYCSSLNTVRGWPGPKATSAYNVIRPRTPSPASSPTAVARSH